MLRYYLGSAVYMLKYLRFLFVLCSYAEHKLSCGRHFKLNVSSLKIYPSGAESSLITYPPKGMSAKEKQPLSSDLAVINAFSSVNSVQSIANRPNRAFSRGSPLSFVLIPSIFQRLRRFSNVPQSIETV